MCYVNRRLTVLHEWPVSSFVNIRKNSGTLFLTYGKHKWMPDRKMLLRKWTRLVSTSNITARNVFLFWNKLFYCAQLDAATFTGHRQLSRFSRSPDRIDSSHFRTDVIVIALRRMIHDSLILNPPPRRIRRLYPFFQYPGPLSSNDLYSNAEFLLL